MRDIITILGVPIDNVTKEESNNANLAKLEVENYNITPKFDKDTQKYRINFFVLNEKWSKPEREK